MTVIKPQTVWLPGGVEIVATDRGGRSRLYVRVHGRVHCLHLSPAGDVLRITRSPVAPPDRTGVLTEHAQTGN